MRGDRQQDFVEQVSFALFRIDEDEYQDQLDILLLGGTIPAQPIPQPDPNCQYCWGFGKVCPCHGVCGAHGGTFLNAHLSKANTKPCECVIKQRR